AEGAQAIPDAPLAAGRWYWRIRAMPVAGGEPGPPSIAWRIDIPRAARSPLAGRSCRAFGMDVNGDGLDDVALGNPSVGGPRGSDRLARARGIVRRPRGRGRERGRLRRSRGRLARGRARLGGRDRALPRQRARMAGAARAEDRGS